MIFKSQVFANFIAGYKLRRNIPTSAENSHNETLKIVMLVTTGSGIKIINVLITPNAIPMAPLERRTIKL